MAALEIKLVKKKKRITAEESVKSVGVVIFKAAQKPIMYDT